MLPAAQVVLAPRATVRGTVGGSGFDGTGAIARIYGHGNAQRWGWLHAELGDRGVLEVVTAVSRRRALSALPPLAFVRLRLDGEDWPRDPLLTAPLLRSRVALPTWTVRGAVGRRRLDVRVTLPAPATVALGYTDPDGGTATCHNSERADADVRLWRWSRGWQLEGEWLLRGRAHAEVGLRP